MKYLPLFVVAALFAAGCSSKSRQAPESEQEELSLDYTPAERNLGPMPYKPPVMDPSVLQQQSLDIVFNDSNYIQYAGAERLGIDPMYTLRDTYFTRRPLVKIRSCDNYTVAELTHSMPFLVPEAAELLDEVGREFRKLAEERGGGKGNKVIVTSVLRSPYTVRQLRRVNANAVDSSTHMFGTTFDLAYNNFDSSDPVRFQGAGRLKQLLAEVLLKKRNEGKCFVKYEMKSPCFHITVNKPEKK